MLCLTDSHIKKYDFFSTLILAIQACKPIFQSQRPPHKSNKPSASTILLFSCLKIDPTVNLNRRSTKNTILALHAVFHECQFRHFFMGLQLEAPRSRILSFIKTSGFSLLFGPYRAYNGYLTGLRQFRVGWWVCMAQVGFGPKSWASTYKADFRVFEGSGKVTF